MKRRVVVTGLGAVTPIGNTVDVFWDEIKKETVGIGPITQFDVSDYKVKIAAQVKGFDARERLDFKSAKRMELFTQYAAAAAKEAFEDAGIDMEKEDPYRAGVIVGSGVGSLKCVEDNYETILKKGPNRVHPLMVPLMISNMAAGNISIRLGLRGKCTNVATACASVHIVSEMLFGQSSMVMQISWLQEERRARSLRQVWQDSRRLRRFLHQKIRLVHQDRLTKTEMDLSWEKEQALLFWKNWNMRRQGAQKYTQSLQGTEQRRTHGTSHHRQKTERAPQWR